MTQQAKLRRRRIGAPRKPRKVQEAHVAEYVFALVRCLAVLTRNHRRFRMTTYFLEMAAMDLAPRLPDGLQATGAGAPDETAQRPTRRAPRADRADG